MSVKEHYDKHLGNFYSWYTGDFGENKNLFKTFCVENSILPTGSRNAIDLGAGNGIQTIALAELGFKVKAIDFNKQLITELESKINDYPIEVINDDIRYAAGYATQKTELIACCGDTLPHLESYDEIKKLLSELSAVLEPDGKIVLTFRDYSLELKDTNRFIPVKSDSQRIFTCFIEYFPDRLRVTDLLYELEDGRWVQKVSSYSKTRILKETVIDYLCADGLDIVLEKTEKAVVTIIAQKPSMSK